MPRPPACPATSSFAHQGETHLRAPGLHGIDERQSVGAVDHTRPVEEAAVPRPGDHSRHLLVCRFQQRCARVVESSRDGHASKQISASGCKLPEAGLDAPPYKV